MFLKELIIEGFKSYAQKTVIKDFDQHFNAITGLNGSGKSNILDSLIFLLGISGYKDLRASDTRDLIYKQGSAGINMASVTGIFDNSDPEGSPNGFQTCPTITVTRQILHTGTNKYFINNSRATQTKVQEMFQSIQLNVANPHFIIMQGRINKVCNMKPHELLKLVEEATGTTMYDAKREQCFRTIEKKSVLVEQTRELLTTLEYRHEQLKDELNKYNELQSIAPLVAEKKHLLDAFQYWSKTQHIKALIHEINEIQTTQEITQKSIEEQELELSQVKTEQKKIQRELQQRADHNKSQEQTMTKNVQTKRVQLNQLTIEQEKLNHHLTRLHQDVATNQEQLEKARHALVQLTQQVQQQEREADIAATARDELQTEIDSLQTTLLGVGSGASGSGNTTLEDHKLNTEQSLTTRRTQLAMIQQDIAHLMNQIETHKHRQQSETHAFDQLVQSITNLEQNVLTKTSTTQDECMQLYTECLAFSARRTQQEVLGEIQGLDLDNGIIMMKQQLQEFRARQQQEQLAVASLEGRIAAPLSGNQSWHKAARNYSVLQYINTSGLVNQIIGLVLNFFKVEQPAKFGLALESAGGSRLFNILVDSYRTGAVLLKNNKNSSLSISVVGLDRLNSKNFSTDIARVREQCPSAILASSLVSASPLCPPALTEPGIFPKLLDYVFGSTFLVTDSVMAKRITKLNCRAILIDTGDVYEPSGLMSGGSTQQMGWFCAVLQSNDAKIAMTTRREHINKIGEFIVRIQNFEGNVLDLNSARAQLTSLKQRKENTSMVRSQQMMEKLGIEIESLTQKKTDIETDIAHLSEKVKTYEKMLSELNTTKGKTGQFKKIISSKQQELKQRVAACERAQTLVEDSTFKLQQDQNDITDIENVLTELSQTIVKDKDRLNEAQRQMLELTSSLAQLEEDQRKISAENTEEQDKLRLITNRVTELQNNIQGLQSQIIQFDKLIEHSKDTQLTLQTQIKQLLKEFKWIRHEEEKFGTTPQYPFTTMNYDKEEQLLQQLGRREQELQRYNNPLAVSQFEQIENEYQDKLAKYNSLENDRIAIQNSIEVLDKKKIETVENTFAVVDRYFSSIFSILLPNATSRLTPQRRDGKLVGCEMQVGFSGHWKESLSELSGGQRSLLALSLILALLRCKPAPLYILDEVDAALDVSHTQNIGRTIKEHFQQSQFIIVSLKEGMFENANMLIRTQLGPSGSVLSVTRRAHD